MSCYPPYPPVPTHPRPTIHVRVSTGSYFFEGRFHSRYLKGCTFELEEAQTGCETDGPHDNLSGAVQQPVRLTAEIVMGKTPVVR